VGAIKQAATELQLEIPHTLRDRRLTEPQHGGGTRKAAGSRHRGKQSQQMKVERHNFYLSHQKKLILSGKAN
jgi:hypothetical protein